MENSYGIGVRNRYELFYDDDVDPLDLIKQSEIKLKDKVSEKENKSTTKVAKKGQNVKKGKTDSLKTVEKITNQSESRSQNRGSRNNVDNRVKFQDREERNNRRNDYNTPRFDGEGKPRDNEGRGRFDGEGRGRFDGEGRGRFDGEGRGRGRGRGMGRGRGRGRGGMGGGKREFDRQSGMVNSSVKPVDKREGSGMFNWGSDKDQIEDYQSEEQQQQQSQAPATELDTSNESPEKTDEFGQTENDDSPKEEEHHEMTLDEWKALQGNVSKPQFNERKAGEGENPNQWKKTYVLKKKEEDESEEESDEDDEENVHGRRKVLLNIDFKFSDSPNRGGRGRGRGRGGERGGRGGRGGMGRGGERGERNDRGPRGGGEGRGRGGRGGMGGRQEAPRMDDEQDFPSLG